MNTIDLSVQYKQYYDGIQVNSYPNIELMPPFSIPAYHLKNQFVNVL